MQNILGVILFIRVPFIAGQAGILLTMGVIGACVVTTILTSLSLSAIATNGRIPAGGPYYVISRNLGAPMGGAVGLLFFLGTTLGATMYVLGAVEAIQTGFDLKDLFPFDTQLIALAIMAVLTGIVFVGVEFVSAVAPVFLAVVILSIVLGVTGVSLFAGGVEFGDSSEVAKADSPAFDSAFQPDPDTDFTPSFVSLLALFYPSVTGIMAGANRSGVLANPGVSIPLGTLGAIATTTTLYVAVTWLFGAFVARDELINNKLVFATLAWPIRYIVNVGIVMSSLGAGLQSLTGAPQLLAVMRRDGVIPSIPVPAWLRGVLGKEVEPDTVASTAGRGAKSDAPSQAGTREILTTYVLASLPCLAGNIDNITPIQTMFFLMMYGAINAACLVLTVVKTPDFRPSWQYYTWWTCALGILSCVTIMMLVSWWQALIVFVLAAALHYWIQRTGESLQWGSWGDSIAAVRLNQATQALLALRKVPMHPKNWRPQLLVLCNTNDNGRPTRPGLLCVAGQLKKGQGLTIVGSVKEGRLLSVLNRAREDYRTLLSQLAEAGLQGEDAARTAARLLASGATSATPAEIAAASSLAFDDALLGLGTVSSLQNDPETIRLRAPQMELQRHMNLNGVDGFPQVVYSGSPSEGLLMLLQTAGLAALAPNMIMLGWPDGMTEWVHSVLEDGAADEELQLQPHIVSMATAKQYVGLLKTSLAMRRSLAVLRGDDDPALSSPEPMQGTIDIWWVKVDSGLLLLLPFLLTKHPKWAKCKLRLFAVISSTDDAPGATKRRLEEYLKVQRIAAQVFTVRVDKDVADAAVANRTLDMAARTALVEASEASTMTMVAARTPTRSNMRRSAADVFNRSGSGAAAGSSSPPPLSPLNEGSQSQDDNSDVASPDARRSRAMSKSLSAMVDAAEIGEGGGVGGGATPPKQPASGGAAAAAAGGDGDTLTPSRAVPAEYASRAARLHSALALNAVMQQQSKDAALVVTNLFVSRSADVKTFVLESELLMRGIPRALLVRGTGGELVTSFEAPPAGFVEQSYTAGEDEDSTAGGPMPSANSQEEDDQRAVLTPRKAPASSHDVVLQVEMPQEALK